MQRLERRCTCEERDWGGEYWKHEQCPACTQWSDQHAILWRELRLKPWQWPAYERPEDAEPPSPERPNPGGPVARYQMLKQAAKA
jgi:hypothetical protein